MNSLSSDRSLNSDARVDVLRFSDYRAYLKEIIHQRRLRNRARGLRDFAKQIEFKSPSALSMILNGKRRLSARSAEAVADVVKLKGKRKQYFLTLVSKELAESDSDALKVQAELSFLKRQRKDRVLKSGQYRFLSAWFYPAIYVLASTSGFRNDPNWIAKKLGGRVSPAQIEQAVADLIELKLIERDGDHWRQTDGSVNTEEETRHLVVREYHRQMIEQATAALGSPSELREYNGLTVAASRDLLPEIKRRIRAFRSELNEFLSRESARNAGDLPEEVYQLNTHFFPLTQTQDSSL